AFDTDGDGTYDVGDGTYAGSGTASSTSFTLPDSGTRDVRLRVIDKDAGQTTYTGAIAVANLAPTASITAAAAGSTVMAHLAATDPSSEDAAAGFTYEVDWGDGA